MKYSDLIFEQHFPKPPIGLRPRYIVTQQRIQEILEAMLRYNQANKKFPAEWVLELDDLNGECT
jgi:hypothetical protein